MDHVYKVISVDLALLKSNPPQLAITAFGQVNSGGWKNGTLEPRYYIVPPTDGIQDFDFVAQPPIGIAIQVILPVTAHHVIPHIPEWLKGVRVHAGSNSLVAARMDATEHSMSEQAE